MQWGELVKLYLAGIYTSNFHKTGPLYARITDRERAARDGVRYYLESYYYIRKQKMVDRIRADGVRIFLDSGAFTAFTKGATIDLHEYCEFIKSNQDIIEVDDGELCVSVLDGIGDPLLTWQNQQAMERLGIRPLPCFHYGEDERYLEWYIENYSYITIGGMVPVSTPQLVHWLDRIWDRYLTKSDGTPKVKVHGFGLTSLTLMERYPWYSVDSSAWVQAASHGLVRSPRFGLITVSESSPAAKQANRHVNTLPPYQRDAIIRHIEEEGFDYQRLQTEYIARWAYNCWSFTKINEELNTRRPVFKKEQMELF